MVPKFDPHVEQLLRRRWRPECGGCWHGGWQKPRKGPKLNPERCYNFWGGRNWPEETEKKPQKGKRETSRK